jgi:hypothetical protein
MTRFIHYLKKIFLDNMTDTPQLNSRPFVQVPIEQMFQLTRNANLEMRSNPDLDLDQDKSMFVSALEKGWVYVLYLEMIMMTDDEFFENVAKMNIQADMYYCTILMLKCIGTYPYFSKERKDYLSSLSLY